MDCMYCGVGKKQSHLLGCPENYDYFPQKCSRLKISWKKGRDHCLEGLDKSSPFEDPEMAGAFLLGYALAPKNASRKSSVLCQTAA